MSLLPETAPPAALIPPDTVNAEPEPPAMVVAGLGFGVVSGSGAEAKV